jgi:uncharacterized Zn finger protein (UPF0148 family)
MSRDPVLLSIRCPHCGAWLAKMKRLDGTLLVACPNCGTVGNDDDVMVLPELEQLRRELARSGATP